MDGILTGVRQEWDKLHALAAATRAMVNEGRDAAGLGIYPELVESASIT
jgi:hypothetical protein